MSVNRVFLIGRLTADPETKVAGQSQTTVCNMRLAVQRRKTNGTDRGAIFIDVAAFDRQAENCAKYLRKGSRVAIDGRLEHSEWMVDDQKRAKHEIVAQEVEFLDNNQSAQPAPENQPMSAPEPIGHDHQPAPEYPGLAAVPS